MVLLPLATHHTSSELRREFTMSWSMSPPMLTMFIGDGISMAIVTGNNSVQNSITTVGNLLNPYNSGCLKL